MTTPNSTTEAGVTELVEWFKAAANAKPTAANGYKLKLWAELEEKLTVFTQSQASAQGGERVEPVGEVRRGHYGGRSRNIGFQEAVLYPGVSVPDGTKLYAPPPAGGGKEALSDAERLTEDEFEEILLALGDDHNGSDFEPECPSCTAYQKIAAIRASQKGQP